MINIKMGLGPSKFDKPAEDTVIINGIKKEKKVCLFATDRRNILFERFKLQCISFRFWTRGMEFELGRTMTKRKKTTRKWNIFRTSFPIVSIFEGVFFIVLMF